MAQGRVVSPKQTRVTPEGVVIVWEDGHTSLYPHRYLRLNCRCATCIGEWPNQGQINPSSVPEDVLALDFMTVGRYALQFLFSDTHYTGIYPYQVLREICPCPQCQQRSSRP